MNDCVKYKSLLYKSTVVLKNRKAFVCIPSSLIDKLKVQIAIYYLRHIVEE